MRKDRKGRIIEILEESANTKLKTKEIAGEINKISEMIIECYRRNGKVVLFGNGGSASDAQHIACEFISRFKLERKSLPSLAFTTNTSILTATGNDYDFSRVFERQVEGLVTKEDVVIGITTSGNSANVIKGIMKAKEIGAKTVAFTGRGGGKIDGISDITLKVPSDDTPRIQEVHITVGHIICELVEKELFGENE